MSLLDFALETTKKYIEQMPKSQRKKYGQFFTSKETAVFMAELSAPEGYVLDRTEYLWLSYLKCL